MKVTCVPGGHQIGLSEAYWCRICDYYICFHHLLSSLTDYLKCRKGHRVVRAR